MANKPQDSSYIARVAAEVGSKTALEVYIKQKEKEKRARVDRRLRDTKRLMRSYREIKIHAGDAIASLKEVETEDFKFFQDIMEERDKTHIDAMLQAYQIICYNSKKPEEQRRYRVLESMYLIDEPLPVKDIAERENIDARTVYKDLDAACEKMSALLFGIQWI